MDIDPAFLRRMPVQIKTRPPDAAGRVDILKKQLSKETLDPDVDLEAIARAIDGFTGSDIRELIRVATMRRMKDLMKDLSTTGKGGHGTSKAQLVRPVSSHDFVFALSKMKGSGATAADYSAEIASARDKTSQLFDALLGSLSRPRPKEGEGDNQGGNGDDESGLDVGGTD
jgi:SpoVK/Ycf46/Vps4 family AAA+-type ATPase